MKLTPEEKAEKERTELLMVSGAAGAAFVGGFLLLGLATDLGLATLGFTGFGIALLSLIGFVTYMLNR